MKKLNLTEIILLTLLAAVSLTSIRQCGSSRRYEKSFKTQVQENSTLKAQIAQVEHENYLKESKLDSFSLAIKKEKAKRKAITASYKLKKTEMEQMSTEDILASLLEDKPLSGTLYDIDSARVSDYGLTKLESKECLAITNSLMNENDVLRKSIGEYAVIAGNLMGDLDDCTLGKIKLEEGVRLKDAENRKLKGKIWNHRSISGCLGIALVAILIL